MSRCGLWWLAERCEYQAHGYEELAADEITVHDVVDGLAAALVVEDYPTFPKGPSVLVLEHDKTGKPVHVVWGYSDGADRARRFGNGLPTRSGKWDETWLTRCR